MAEQFARPGWIRFNGGAVRAPRVDLFNASPAAALVLKPCCLPGAAFRRKHGDRWSVGGHSFPTQDVCVAATAAATDHRGRWAGRAAKEQQAPKFARWVERGLSGRLEAGSARRRPGDAPEGDWHGSGLGVFIAAERALCLPCAPPAAARP
eukprot:gene3861-19416_t